MFRKFLLVALLCPVIVCSAVITEGKDYVLLSTGGSSQTGRSVTEFFSYGCPWCYRVENKLNSWLQAQQALQFKRVAVVFNKDWAVYARAFYTAKALSLQNKLTPALFKAIQDDKKPLNTNEAMIQFFVLHGVDKATAKSAFNNSPSIDMALANSKQDMAKYQINAVPAFVVNGRYKTNLAMAGGIPRLFAILDALLAKDDAKKQQT